MILSRIYSTLTPEIMGQMVGVKWLRHIMEVMILLQSVKTKAMEILNIKLKRKYYFLKIFMDQKAFI